MNITPIQSCYAGRASQPWSGSTGRVRDCGVPADGDGASPADSSTPPSVPFQIQPPWKVLPWPKPVGPVINATTVAVVVVNPNPGLADVTAVGRTLDLFV